MYLGHPPFDTPIWYLCPKPCHRAILGTRIGFSWQRQNDRKVREAWDSEVEIKHDVHISVALRTWEAGSSLKQPSRNWIQAHWGGRGTNSDQGKWCWVHWKVTGKRKSHFPRLLISVSQSTLGLNFSMWEALWALLWRKEACSQHFLSSKGRTGKATIPWHVGSLHVRVPGEN